MVDRGAFGFGKMIGVWLPFGIGGKSNPATVVNLVRRR